MSGAELDAVKADVYRLQDQVATLQHEVKVLQRALASHRISEHPHVPVPELSAGVIADANETSMEAS